MENRSVCDNNRNIVNLNAQFFLQRMTNKVGFTFSVGDNTWGVKIGIEQHKENW